MKDSISPRGVEILNAFVAGWADGHAKLPGRMSYQEVFDWLESVGAEQPSGLIEILDHLKSLKK